MVTMKSAMSARLAVALFLVVAAVQGADALRHALEQQGVAARDCPVDFRKVNLMSVEAACNTDVADVSLCCTTLYRTVTPYAGVLNAIESCAGAFLDAFAASGLSNNDQVLRCFEENVAAAVAVDTAARVLQDEPAPDSKPMGSAPPAPEVETNVPQGGKVPSGKEQTGTASASASAAPSSNSARSLGVGFGSVIAAVATCILASVFIVA